MKTVYKYIKFTALSLAASICGRTTYECTSKKGGDLLGYTEWYSDWKQYIFWAAGNKVVFSADCLEDIADFLKQLNAQEKK